MWQGFPSGFGFLLSNRRPGLAASMLLHQRVATTPVTISNHVEGAGGQVHIPRDANPSRWMVPLGLASEAWDTTTPRFESETDSYSPTPIPCSLVPCSLAPCSLFPRSLFPVPSFPVSLFPVPCPSFPVLPFPRSLGPVFLIPDPCSLSTCSVRNSAQKHVKTCAKVRIWDR